MNGSVTPKGRGPESRLVTAAFVALATSGCVGEASVHFKGSVTAAEAAGADYEEARATAAPIAAATVIACRCNDQRPCTCAPSTPFQDKSDASGAYDVRDIVFGGFVGVENVFQVTAEAPGYERATFTLNYDKPARERAFYTTHPFLNFKLKKAAVASGGLRLDDVVKRELRLAANDAPSFVSDGWMPLGR